MLDSIALQKLSVRLGSEMRSHGQYLAVAESCTGGWIAKCCTDVAGSSQWFDRGFVTYSNQAKREMVAVSPDTLVSQGAVSEAVVREMASGALANSQAGISIAVSGIAGPGGGTVEKPVGTVWLAWATGKKVITLQHCYQGDREAVRRQTVATALQGVLDLLADS